MSTIFQTISKSFRNHKLKKLVNVYQLHYKNGVAQGFGDYLRGCFCLLQISNMLGLQFDMDLKNHPMSKFLQENDTDIIYPINYSDVYRYEDLNYIPINPKKYNKDSVHFMTGLVKKFNTINASDYYFFCHSLPIFDQFTPQGRRFVMSKIMPNEMMRRYIDDNMITLGLKVKQYAVIHIRCGDTFFLKNKHLSEFLVSNVLSILLKSIRSSNTYLILSDNNQMKHIIKKIFPNVIIHSNNITHLGESTDQTEESIMNTLLDFYLMSQSYQIISFSSYNWGSGFSQWCSVIYNIPFSKFVIA